MMAIVSYLLVVAVSAGLGVAVTVVSVRKAELMGVVGMAMAMTATRTVCFRLVLR
jgi:hypothetical protein